ncbi:MAG: hypothetical protein H7X99_01480 [Saprospiraceae bacterium]|nr:hypothetical protein [Saprospiraceae bacterium]
MRKLTILCAFLMFSSVSVEAQNIGINNSDPQAALDINGAMRIRPLTFDVTSGTLAITGNEGFVVLTGTPTMDPVLDVTAPFTGVKMIIRNSTLRTCLFPEGNKDILSGSVCEYLFDGVQWQCIASNINHNVWNLDGNWGTDTMTQFIGTKDDNVVKFKVDNTEKMRLTQEGLKITNDNTIEFGYGIENKPFGNGRIVYNNFSPYPALDIYGGGNAFDGYDRRITMWAQGGTTFTGGGSFNGSVNVLGEIKPGGNTGTAGQVLTSTGNGTMQWATPGSNSGYKYAKTISQYGAATWTVPPDVTEVMIELWGAGAGSNGVAGGISGHYGRVVKAVAPYSTLNFNIGKGGNGSALGITSGGPTEVNFPGGDFLHVKGGDVFYTDFLLLGNPTFPVSITNINNAIMYPGNLGEATTHQYGQKSETIFTEYIYFGYGGIPPCIEYKFPKVAGFQYYENGTLVQNVPYQPFSYPACGGMATGTNTGLYGGDGIAIIWWNEPSGN